VHRSAAEGHRVLIVAPYGRDAESVSGLLTSNGYDARICDTFGEVAAHLDAHAGVILVTEEALASDLSPLESALMVQPPWSDIPFILLTGRRAGRDRPAEAMRQRLPSNATNVVLIERPLSAESLLSTIVSAMRARQRQFVMRDQLAELDTQRTRLETLLENLPIGVAFLDTQGSSVLTNPAFKQFSKSGKCPAFDVDAELHWQAQDRDGAPLPRDKFPSARALKGEHITGIELRYYGLDSGPVWTRASSVPLLNDDGSVAGAISVLVDIDEQKRAQEKLAHVAEMLES